VEHWHRAAPEWLSRLAAAGDVDQTGRYTLGWLGQEQATSLRDALIAPWCDDGGESARFREANRARVARAVPVAVGPKRVARITGIEQAIMLMFDEASPDRLWATLDPSLPPLLWIPLGNTRTQIDDALAPYLVEQPVPAARLPKRARGFMGTAEQLGAGIEEIENCVVLHEPWIDPPSWGSQYDDDPYPQVLPPMNVLVQTRVVHEYMRQAPGRLRSTSYRSLWSRSSLTFECHPFEAFVAAVRYAPSRHSAVIHELNTHHGTRLPVDLPVDLAASLLRCAFVEEHTLRAELASASFADPFLALALCAVAPGQTSTIDTLRDLATMSEMVGPVAQVADAYGYDSLLLELLAEVQDPRIRDALEQALAPSDAMDVPDGDDLDDGPGPGDLVVDALERALDEIGGRTDGGRAP